MMATRAMLYAGMTVCLLCCGAGRSIADGEVPKRHGLTVPKPFRTGPVALAHPSDPAFYTFTGHPLIRAWASVPRRT